MIFKNLDYTTQRLGNTVIRIGKDPHFITPYDEWDWKVKCLETGLVRVEDIRKIDIDLNPVPLGYVQYGGDTYYLSRKPARRWKQGLSKESLSGVRGLGGMLTTKQLHDCIVNIYEDVSVCYRRLGEGFLSTTFHRDFAFRKDGRIAFLHYKGKRVGTVTSGFIKLEDRFSFLKEALGEAVL